MFGRRDQYREYLRANNLSAREARHVTSAAAMRGYIDVDVVFLPYWWEAYRAADARSIEDQVRALEAIRGPR